MNTECFDHKLGIIRRSIKMLDFADTNFTLGKGAG